MSAAVFMRSSNWTEAQIHYERLMELAPDVEFQRFEAFTKAKHLASWKLELGEIYYLQGKIDKCKTILEEALVDMAVTIDTGDVVKKNLNDLMKKHAWTVFKGKDKGDIDKKWDTTGDVNIRVMARLFVIAILDLNEVSFIGEGGC